MSMRMPERWDAVQRGDRAAIETMCRTWLPVVLQWTRRLGGPRVDADSATQEVFIVALRRLHTVRAPEAFERWLFSVTRRVLSQHRRAVWGRRWESDQQVDDMSGPANPEADFTRMTQATQIQEVVATLPEDLAAVLVLYDVEGRTMPEVVDMLGVSEGTLRTRLRSARAQFRKVATKRGLIPEESK